MVRLLFKGLQEQRKHNCLTRTEKAIAELKKKGQRLSFANIARAADVSVSYLYKYPEIKHHIQDLRTEQERNGKPPTPQSRSDIVQPGDYQPTQRKD